MALGHHDGMNAQLDPIVAVGYADGQQLDDIAVALGDGDVARRNVANTFSVNFAVVEVTVEGHRGQDGQLIGCVVSIYIGCWIGLGIPKPLGFGQDISEFGAFLVHLGQDEVGGAIDNAQDFFEAVGGQRLTEGVDDWNAATHAGFEVQCHVVFARHGEELGAFLGDELLVGCDDMLAGCKGRLDEHLCRLDAADDFDHDVNVWVA